MPVDAQLGIASHHRRFGIMQSLTNTSQCIYAVETQLLGVILPRADGQNRHVSRGKEAVGAMAPIGTNSDISFSTDEVYFI